MFKKLNIKTLIVLLLSLLIIIIVLKVFRNKGNERSFPEQLISIDTSEISGIQISAFNQEPLKISNINNKWIIQHKGKEFKADENRIKEMFQLFANLKPKSMAGTDQTCWREFQVNDSAALTVSLEKDGKIIDKLILGKFSYQQPDQNSPMAMYGQQQGTLSTYVRINDDERVYVVDGFLRMNFQTDVNSYRDQTVTKLIKNSITRLSFSYPADSSFTLEKKNNNWFINNMEADSNAINNYLSYIERINSAEFIPSENTVSGIISHRLKIEGTTLFAPAEITATPTDTVTRFAVRSSMNEGAVFSGNGNSLFNTLFVSAKKFQKQISQ